jgi:hypothetical protein
MPTAVNPKGFKGPVLKKPKVAVRDLWESLKAKTE